MNADRDTLPDRILTTDDGRQVEYWYGPGQHAIASLAHERPVRDVPAWVLDLREGHHLCRVLVRDLDRARRVAAAWTA